MTISNFCSLPQPEVKEIEMQEGWFEAYYAQFHGKQTEARDETDEARDTGRH